MPLTTVQTQICNLPDGLGAYELRVSSAILERLAISKILDHTG